jgi:hypothetical protein
MKRFAAFAIVAGWLAFPVLAQHSGGGGHAGFSGGHAASAGHAGFARGSAASSPRHTAMSPRYGARAPMASGARQPAFAPRYAFRSSALVPGFGRQQSGSPAGRVSDRRDGHHRREYISVYPGGYGYSTYPLIYPGYPTVLDYGDTGDTGNAGYSEPGQDSGPVYYDNGPYQEQQQSPSLLPWSGNAPPVPANEGQAQWPSSEPAVTLIFKDGSRQPLQVHNYALTQSTVFIGDGRGISIPIDDIDLPATVKANRDAGVEFRLPRALN